MRSEAVRRLQAAAGVATILLGTGFALHLYIATDPNPQWWAANYPWMSSVTLALFASGLLSLVGGAIWAYLGNSVPRLPQVPIERLPVDDHMLVPRTISKLLIVLGGLLTLLSIVLASSVVALLGLGFIFWGSLLTYVTPRQFVKASVFSATALSLMLALDRMLEKYKKGGKAVYLPPRYFREADATFVLVGSFDISAIPNTEKLRGNELEASLLPSRLDQGFLFMPPGAELLKTFEDALGTSFTKVDIRYIEEHVPKLLVDDLELARRVEVDSEKDRVDVTIENPAYRDMYRAEISDIIRLLGCPVASSIACALAKASGRPVFIEDYQAQEENNHVVIRYRLL
jgi:hypothetical protein